MPHLTLAPKVKKAETKAAIYFLPSLEKWMPMDERQEKLEMRGEAVHEEKPLASLVQKIGLRLKPGPKKRDDTRTEKVSCRLTTEERAEGVQYCKAHGLTEAKLLRAAYLAAITQTPDDKIKRLAEAIAHSPDKSVPGIKAILKKGGMVLFFLLLSTAAAPTIAKYALQIYEAGHAIIYHQHEACIYHDNEMGCEMVPYYDKK